MLEENGKENGKYKLTTEHRLTKVETALHERSTKGSGFGRSFGQDKSRKTKSGGGSIGPYPCPGGRIPGKKNYRFGPRNLSRSGNWFGCR